MQDEEEKEDRQLTHENSQKNRNHVLKYNA